MFDIGWTELLVIAVVAIIIVGPKDLPGMLRSLGRYAGKLKRAAGEFRQQFDDAIRDSELDELRSSMRGASNLNPANQIRDSINESFKPVQETTGGLKDDIEKAGGSSTSGGASGSSAGSGSSGSAGASASSASTAGSGAEATGKTAEQGQTKPSPSKQGSAKKESGSATSGKKSAGKTGGGKAAGGGKGASTKAGGARAKTGAAKSGA